jgi:hypothetical protein
MSADNKVLGMPVSFFTLSLLSLSIANAAPWSPRSRYQTDPALVTMHMHQLNHNGFMLMQTAIGTDGTG